MSPARPVPSAPLPRGPFVLLGLMTATVLVGPFLIGAALAGGARAHWPPDRPIEWATVLGVSGLVLVLMLACLSLGLVNRQAVVRTREANQPQEPSEVADRPPGASS